MSRNGKKLRGSAVCAIFAAVLAVSGCGNIRFGEIRTGTSKDTSVLLQIGSEKISQEEGALLLAAWKDRYSDLYGQDLWTETLSAELKSEAAVYVEDVFLASRSAQASGAQVGDDVKVKVESAAEQYCAQNDGADRELVSDAYVSLYLADQNYESYLSSQDITVEDEEARVVTVRQIYIPFADDTEKEAAKKTMDTVVRRVNNGKMYFQVGAARYNQADTITRQIRRGELPSDQETEVFALADGQLSSVFEEEGGWRLFQCVDAQTEPASSENAESIRKQKALQLFSDSLKTFADQNGENWNSSSWDALTVSGDGSVTGDGFFDLYQSVVLA